MLLLCRSCSDGTKALRDLGISPAQAKHLVVLCGGKVEGDMDATKVKVSFQVRRRMCVWGGLPLASWSSIVR